MIDEDAAAEEARYDRFYAMMHNLDEAGTRDVLKIAKGRWEIEESFRITKTQMRARPIDLSRKKRTDRGTPPDRVHRTSVLPHPGEEAGRQLYG